MHFPASVMILVQSLILTGLFSNPVQATSGPVEFQSDQDTPPSSLTTIEIGSANRPVEAIEYKSGWTWYSLDNGRLKFNCKQPYPWPWSWDYRFDIDASTIEDPINCLFGRLTQKSWMLLKVEQFKV